MLGYDDGIGGQGLAALTPEEARVDSYSASDS